MKFEKKGIFLSLHKYRVIVIGMVVLTISTMVSLAVKDNYLSSYTFSPEAVQQASQKTEPVQPKSTKPKSLAAVEVLPEAKWVDSTFKTMSLDQKIGQFFMVAAYSNKDERHYQQINNLVTQHHIGGIVFFQGGPYRQAVLTNRWQSVSTIPLLIGIDGEWGLGMRLDSTVSFPKQMILGAVQDNNLIYQMGVEVAKHCKRMGIHVNFAPVVDINSNPDNPVIGIRSFGEDKINVAAKSSAYMKGMQHNHIITAAKHFPGHGDTGTDSHFDLPVLTHTYETLFETDLFPYRKLITDSLMGVMSGHLHIPVIDDTPNIPGSLSPKVVNGLLREQLGFRGIVFTDAMNMQGVLKSGKASEINLRALTAGNDILVFAQSIPETVTLIKEALKKKTITEKFINEKVKRILKAKYWAGLHALQPVELNNLYEDLNPASSQNLIRNLNEAAVTVVKNENNLLPFQDQDLAGTTTVTIGGGTQSPFQKMLTSYYGPMSHHVFAASDINATDVSNMISYLKPYSTVIVAVHNISSRANRNYGVNESVIDFINQLKSSGKNTVLCIFGTPYSLRVLPVTDAVICANEDNSYTQQITSQVIMGALNSRGKIPVSAPGIKAGFGIETVAMGKISFGIPESVGMRTSSLERISDVVQDAISQQVFPGCQVLVARKGKIVYERNFGTLAYNDSERVSSETIYDLASVSKVTSTLQGIMLLYEKGLVSLNEKASTYLPELKKTNKQNITIRDLLIHRSGMLAYYPKLWKNTMTAGGGLMQEYYSAVPDDEYSLQVAPRLFANNTMPDSVWKWIVESPLKGKPNKTGQYGFLYSDLGFVVLQKVIERVTNQTLDSYVSEQLYRPLHLPALAYNPLHILPAERIAPTENDHSYRGQLLRGTVHDPMAAMLGGIAGHAGLFGNARSLTILLQLQLWKGKYAGKDYFKQSTIEEFTKLASSSGSRALGWIKARQDVQSNVVSPNASPASFGHTGFTGNVVWVDPSQDLIFVFLSNRVYPDSGNNKLNSHKTRRKIHDIIYQSIEEVI